MSLISSWIVQAMVIILTSDVLATIVELSTGIEFAIKAVCVLGMLEGLWCSNAHIHLFLLCMHHVGFVLEVAIFRHLSIWKERTRVHAIGSWKRIIVSHMHSARLFICNILVDDWTFVSSRNLTTTLYYESHDEKSWYYSEPEEERVELTRAGEWRLSEMILLQVLGCRWRNVDFRSRLIR